MDQYLKARKPYVCDACERVIEKGEVYLFGKGREPRYNDDDIQVGIRYYQFRCCLKWDCGVEAEIIIDKEPDYIKDLPF